MNVGRGSVVVSVSLSKWIITLVWEILPKLGRHNPSACIWRQCNAILIILAAFCFKVLQVSSCMLMECWLPFDGMLASSHCMLMMR